MASSSAAAGSFAGQTWQSPSRKTWRKLSACRAGTRTGSCVAICGNIAQCGAGILACLHSGPMWASRCPAAKAAEPEDHRQPAVFCVSCWRRLQGSINRSKRRLYKHQSPERKRRAKRVGQHREPQARPSTKESELCESKRDEPIEPNRRDRHSCRSIAAKRRRGCRRTSHPIGPGTSIPAARG